MASMEEAKPRQEWGCGKDWPWAPKVPIPQASQPPVCPGPAGPPDQLRRHLCELLSSTGPEDSNPAQKEADAGGAATTGRTVCPELSAGAAGRVGGLRGRHGERRLGSGPGKPTPYSVGARPTWLRPTRLSTDPRGSDLGPALTPRDTSTTGRVPVAITSHPAAFPGTRLLSSQSREDLMLIRPELCQELPPCGASHHQGQRPLWPRVGSQAVHPPGILAAVTLGAGD